MDTNPDKLCTECKWFRRRWFASADLGECKSPRQRRSLVDGSPEIKFVMNVRRFDCEGRFWEPKRADANEGRV